jgi:hypothetical protein
MSRKLSKLETIVLRVILDSMPHGATGSDLVHGERQALGSISPQDVSLAGVHRTAASLCRKSLAWRAGTSKLQFYKITQTGRDALKGDVAGKWVAR